MIEFNDLKKSFDGRDIFSNISGKINEGDKIGLVGINGVGKTTLLRILLKEEDYDEGIVTYRKNNLIINYFSQNYKFEEEKTIYEYLFEYFSNKNTKENNENYVKSKVKRLLLKLGFSENEFNKNILSLSGGEKTKISLCKVFSNKPDLLILDEPTNHLDLNNIKILEDIISKLNITMLIVSHDRAFLDNTVNTIFELTSKKLNVYDGNYTKYKNIKDVEFVAKCKEYEKQEKEIKKLKSIIIQREVWAQNTKNKCDKTSDFYSWKDKSKNQSKVIKAKKKQLKKLEDKCINKPKEEITDIFNIINKDKGRKTFPNHLIKVSSLTKKYNSRVILENINFNIEKNDRIGLIGDNGSGKTSIVKLIMNIDKDYLGNIHKTPSLKIGYFSQELENLNFKNTILDELSQELFNIREISTVITSLSFTFQDLNKKIMDLSMGEKCRISFAKLILSKPDMLILDEPTNFMDIVSKENFEDVLAKYKGSILVISHDRYLISKVCNKIFEIKNKKLDVYLGNYKYYLEAKNIRNKKGCFNLNKRGRLSLVEYRLALVSSKLGNKYLSIEEKEMLEKEFFSLMKEKKELLS